MFSTCNNDSSWPPTNIFHKVQERAISSPTLLSLYGLSFKVSENSLVCVRRHRPLFVILIFFLQEHICRCQNNGNSSSEVIFSNPSKLLDYMDKCKTPILATKNIYFELLKTVIYHQTIKFYSEQSWSGQRSILPFVTR